MHSTGIPHFLCIPYFCILLCFANIAFFTKWMFVATLSSKSIGAIFPKAFFHSFLSHFDNSCKTSDIFIIILCIMVISDVTVVIVKGCTTHVHIRICSDCSSDWPDRKDSPIFLPLFRPSFSLRNNNVEIKPINNLAFPRMEEKGGRRIEKKKQKATSNEEEKQWWILTSLPFLSCLSGPCAFSFIILPYLSLQNITLLRENKLIYELYLLWFHTENSFLQLWKFDSRQYL